MKFAFEQVECGRFVTVVREVVVLVVPLFQDSENRDDWKVTVVTDGVRKTRHIGEKKYCERRAKQIREELVKYHTVK